MATRGHCRKCRGDRKSFKGCSLRSRECWVDLLVTERLVRWIEHGNLSRKPGSNGTSQKSGSKDHQACQRDVLGRLCWLFSRPRRSFVGSRLESPTLTGIKSSAIVHKL